MSEQDYWLIALAIYVGGLIVGFFAYGYTHKTEDILEMEGRDVGVVFLWPVMVAVMIPMLAGVGVAWCGKKVREIIRPDRSLPSPEAK